MVGSVGCSCGCQHQICGLVDVALDFMVVDMWVAGMGAMGCYLAVNLLVLLEECGENIINKEIFYNILIGCNVFCKNL